MSAVLSWKGCQLAILVWLPERPKRGADKRWVSFRSRRLEVGGLDG